jgi:transcriptional pleiotropic regulator of transition state genes
MKATGIVRRIDPLGRLVIPREILDTRGLGAGSPMAFYVEDEKIILQPYNPGCTFCGACDEVTLFCGKPICYQCLDKLVKKKDALSA